MSSIQREYEEKRDYIRMFVDASVEITDPITGNTFKGDSKDLSATGVAFVTDNPFDIGQRLNVKISSTQSKLAPLEADFTVMRADKLDDGHYHVAGSIGNVN
ncbi:PilZ domain-containing protein [Pleionea sp. CnH1-48]|uniref:PilZ domain-containing protein n=1 Tax=Pleionea sp. CnH1-48 TaxID=2954494 RepID=UPI002097C88E|nr:PilZ domain-containing protein [Pleionea sp. CnH1-48]MCO7223606.1 PilZ domain-containing protein [Pleionea sp. CnH1-48]